MNLYHVTKKNGFTEKSIDKISTKAKSGYYWIDIVDSKSEDIKLLHDKLQIDLETVDVALQKAAPGVIDFGLDYKGYVFHLPSLKEKNNQYKINKLVILFNQSFVITLRFGSDEWFGSLQNSILKNPKRFSDNSAKLLIQIVRRLGDEFGKIMSNWEERLEDIWYEETTEFEYIEIKTYLKLKDANRVVYRELMECNEIVKDLLGNDFADDVQMELMGLLYKIDTLLARSSDVAERLKSLIESFHSTGLQKQRRLFKLMFRLLAFTMPTLIILLFSSLILPHFELSYTMQKVLWPFIATLAGMLTGVLIIAKNRM